MAGIVQNDDYFKVQMKIYYTVSFASLQCFSVKYFYKIVSYMWYVWV